MPFKTPPHPLNHRAIESGLCGLGGSAGPLAAASAATSAAAAPSYGNAVSSAVPRAGWQPLFGVGAESSFSFSQAPQLMPSAASGNFIQAALPGQVSPDQLPPGQLAMLRLQQILGGDSDSRSTGESAAHATPVNMQQQQQQQQRELTEQAVVVRSRQIAWMQEQQQHWLGSGSSEDPLIKTQQDEDGRRSSRRSERPNSSACET